MAVYRFFWNSDWISHYQLLCGGIRLVSAISLRFCIGTSQGRPHLHQGLFHQFLTKRMETHFLDRCIPLHHPFCYHQRCSERHRMGIKTADACAFRPITYYCGFIMSAAQRIRRHPFYILSRLFEGDGRHYPRCTWSSILFAEHRHGMSLHLRFLFLARN